MPTTAHPSTSDDAYWNQHLAGFVELAVLGGILSQAMFRNWLQISSFKQQTWKESNSAEQQKHRKHLGSLLGAKAWRCMGSPSLSGGSAATRNSTSSRHISVADNRQLLADNSRDGEDVELQQRLSQQFDGAQPRGPGASVSSRAEPHQQQRTQLVESGDDNVNVSQIIRTCRQTAGIELLLGMLTIVSSGAYFAVLPAHLTANVPEKKLSIFTLLGFFVLSILFILLNQLLDASMGMMFVERVLNLRCFKGCRHALARTWLPVLQGRSRTGRLFRFGVLKPLDICWVWLVKTVMFPLVCTYQTKPPRVTLYPELTCWDNGQHWSLVLLSTWSIFGMVSWQLSQLLRQSGWPQNMYWHQFEGVYSRGRETLTVNHEKLATGEHRLRAVRHVKEDSCHSMKSQYTLKVVPPFEPQCVVVEAYQEGTEEPAGFASFASGWPCMRCAEEGAEEHSPSSMLFLTVCQNDIKDTDYIDLSPIVEDVCRPPPVFCGRWKHVAFLKVPYFQDPEVAFWMAALKIVGSVLWASFGHRAAHYRCILSLFMACLAFAGSWIVGRYKPWAFHCLNYSAALTMFLAGGVSLVAFVLSLHTDADALLQHWSTLTMPLVVVAGVVFLSIICPIMFSCFTWGPRCDMLWAVNSEETAERLTLTLKEWRQGHQVLKERLGEGLAPCQIENYKTLKSCRILQVEVDGEMTPWEECIEGGRLQESEDVISYVVGATQLVEQEQQLEGRMFTVTISNEWHPWPSLTTLAEIEARPPTAMAKRHDLARNGSGHIDEKMPRTLVLGICGHGKSTLLSALSRFSHANQGFKVLKGFAKEGVTQETHAIQVTHDNTSRLYIDMPGMEDGKRERDEIFLADAKNTLSSASDGASQNFLNQFLLVVNVHMMRRSSQLEGLLKTLCAHFGASIVDLLTVVFTHKDSSVEQLERQTEILQNLKSTFRAVFGRAVADVEFQLTSSLSAGPATRDNHRPRHQRTVPCFFIDCLAALPDRSWQYSLDARVDARRTLKLIEQQIDSSVQVRFPTGRWPNMISSYSGEELIYEADSELKPMVPTFTHERFPTFSEHQQEFSFTVQEEEDRRLDLAIDKQGVISGKLGAAAEYTIHVTISWSPGAINEGLRVVRSCATYTFTIKVVMSREQLGQYINEALDKKKAISKEEESECWEDAWEFVLKQRNKHEVAELKMAKDYMESQRCEVDAAVLHVLRTREEQNERVNYVYGLLRKSEEEKKLIQNRLSESVQELGSVKTKLEIVKDHIRAQSRLITAGSVVKITGAGDMLDKTITIKWSASWVAVLESEMEEQGRGSEDYTVQTVDNQVINPIANPPDESSFPLRFIPKEQIHEKNGICHDWDELSGKWWLLILGAKNPPVFVNVHSDNLSLMPSRCQNYLLSNSVGAITSCQAPSCRCPDCKLSFCSYHAHVNLSDALLSLKGHVCPYYRRDDSHRSRLFSS
eukprot:TRINITY_DN1050_c0_g1_i1.p1 TRINITY_DN1050_c0_g1~~TRINITY_DN1050_c0_g1_i1.p1  ORF type:complete len:1474 (-),score=202.74 TRINITY_DN1050_c0_g1_i1:68-4417(-)